MRLACVGGGPGPASPRHRPVSPGRAAAAQAGSSPSAARARCRGGGGRGLRGQRGPAGSAGPAPARHLSPAGTAATPILPPGRNPHSCGGAGPGSRRRRGDPCGPRGCVMPGGKPLFAGWSGISAGKATGEVRLPNRPRAAAWLLIFFFFLPIFPLKDPSFHSKICQFAAQPAARSVSENTRCPLCAEEWLVVQGDATNSLVPPGVAQAGGWGPGAGAGQEEGAGVWSAPPLRSWQGGCPRAGQGWRQMGCDQLL